MEELPQRFGWRASLAVCFSACSSRRCRALCDAITSDTNHRWLWRASTTRQILLAFAPAPKAPLQI